MEQQNYLLPLKNIAPKLGVTYPYVCALRKKHKIVNALPVVKDGKVAYVNQHTHMPKDVFDIRDFIKVMVNEKLIAAVKEYMNDSDTV